jgi:hypothetical protein
VSCSANGRVIAGVGSDPTGHFEAWIAQVDPLPPRVTDTQVNGGAVQRSRVTDLAVTFDSQVTFASSPGVAFTLTRVSDGAPVNFTATAIVVGGVSVVVLDNFTGPATQFGSLADGRYTLTALASQISAGGAALAGGGPNGNYVSPTDTFGGTGLRLYRLFGDASGDGVVDATDLGLFRSTFNANNSQANYLGYLDADNSGAIDASDLSQFRTRFNENVFGP